MFSFMDDVLTLRHAVTILSTPDDLAMPFDLDVEGF